MEKILTSSLFKTENEFHKFCEKIEIIFTLHRVRDHIIRHIDKADEHGHLNYIKRLSQIFLLAYKNDIVIDNITIFEEMIYVVEVAIKATKVIEHDAKKLIKELETLDHELTNIICPIS